MVIFVTFSWFVNWYKGIWVSQKPVDVCRFFPALSDFLHPIIMGPYRGIKYSYVWHKTNVELIDLSKYV